MLKIVKNTIYYFLLVILLSYPISFYISANFNTYSKQNWALKITGLKLDYAVLGSSRVYNMIDIKSLDSTFEKKGINLGTSGSGYAENYIILSEFIHKNKISTLNLNTDEFCFNSKNSYGYPFHDYEFLPLFTKYNNIFYDNIPKWKYYLWNVIPLTKYIEFNKQFTLKAQNLIDENMGSALLNEVNKKEELEIKRVQTKFTEVDKKYFLKIIQLCKLNNIKMILITTPICNKNYEYEKLFLSIYIKSISSKFNLKHYGFESLIEINHTNFNNNTHTNVHGSKEYSINLGKLLKKNNE